MPSRAKSGRRLSRALAPIVRFSARFGISSQATLVPIAATTASPVLDQYGRVVVGHNMFVYSPGTSSQIQVYDSGGSPISQPVVTSSAGVIPGFLYSGTIFDVVDSSTGNRASSVQALSAGDLARLLSSLGQPSGISLLGTDGKVGGSGGSPLVSLDAVPAPAADVTLAGHKLTNVDDAAGATDAVNRQTGDGRYGGILKRAAVKSTTYTAAVGDNVPCDISGGSFTVTLPTTPVDNARIAVKVVAVSGTPGSTMLTIAAGGSDVFNKAGGSTSLALTALFQGVIVQYDLATGVWTVQSTDTPLGSALGAAKLGTDGTVGGPSGSGLASSVVSTTSPTTSPLAQTVVGSTLADVQAKAAAALAVGVSYFYALIDNTGAMADFGSGVV